jgi:hypothetical protein
VPAGPRRESADFDAARLDACRDCRAAGERGDRNRLVEGEDGERIVKLLTLLMGRIL